MARRPARRSPSNSADAPEPRSFYDCPQWYDIVHAAGTAAEVNQLERVNRQFGAGGGRWLEPACGTGRFLRVLARRGYVAVGYDTNPLMLDYARQRLGSLKERVQLCKGDMATFAPPGAFDFAFNLINTFRHLMEPADALAHLNCVARSLKPGGAYLLGLDLADYDDPQPGEETWIARRGSCQVRHIMFNIPPEPHLRRERIINHLIVDKPSGRETFHSHYDLLSYNLAQWISLLDESDLQCVAAFDFDWNSIDINGYTRDANFVLKRRDD